MHSDAGDLVRITCTDDGRLVAGRDLPGRGAWLCEGSAACLAAAVRSKAFQRSLRCDLAPGAVEQLVAVLGWTER